MEFQNECLKAHNEYRKKHGVPPLKLNKDISKFSQQWADNLIKKGVLQHSNDKDYGENLFCIQSSNTNFTVSGREAVDSWYDEIKVHTFGIEPKSLASGHFTQVIWKDSKELGVAFARSGGKVVVVANYYPPGNIIGHFDENVPPIGGSGPSKTENNNHIPLTSGFSKLSLFKGSSKDLVKATEGNFEQDFLDAHNKYRRRHGTPPLELDKQLSKYATEWAKHLATKNILEHRPGSNYGENIYCIYSSDPTFVVNGNSPVDTWYEEIKDHPFGREPSNLKSGHFTQVVWKDSKQLGVGVAKNAQGNIYVVANYSPAGNFVKHYVENVPPVKPNFYDDEVLTNIMKKEKQEASSSSEAKSKTEDKSSTENKEAFTQFVIDAWKVHNEYRRKHGVPELSLSEKLCNFAQDWAETCAKTASLQHRANNPYGENIFSVYSSDYSHVPTARDAVKEWYDEIKLHTFGVEKVNQKSLHFTQVVWKNSTHLGIGMAQNKKGQTYVVANYEPRGNYIGQFVENVPKPKP